MPPGQPPHLASTPQKKVNSGRMRWFRPDRQILWFDAAISVSLPRQPAMFLPARIAPVSVKNFGTTFPCDSALASYDRCDVGSLPSVAHRHDSASRGSEIDGHTLCGCISIDPGGALGARAATQPPSGPPAGARCARSNAGADALHGSHRTLKLAAKLRTCAAQARSALAGRRQDARHGGTSRASAALRQMSPFGQDAPERGLRGG